MEPSMNSYGGGYNASFGYPNQQLASFPPSNSNANLVPLGSVHRFPLIRPQHNSNANFVPLGSVRRFPSNPQEQREAALANNEDALGMQSGRKQRSRKGTQQMQLNNGLVSEQNKFGGSVGVSCDHSQQWDGWAETQQFAHRNEADFNYGQFGFEPIQPHEEQGGAYYDLYEFDANWHQQGAAGDEAEQWREKSEQRTHKRQYFCETCKVSCGGEPSYRAHLVGKTHRKKLEAQRQNANPYTEKPLYHCEMCSVFSATRENFRAHVVGQKHQRALKLVLEKNGSAPVIECPGDSFDEPTTSAALLSEASRQLCDQFVREKVAQIELEPDDLCAIEHLVQRVEQALYAVSNLLRENADADGTAQPRRLLHGIMRVGLMAKKQLLKGDRRTDLVLLCSVVPTFDILFQTVALFRQTINNTDREPFVHVVEKSSDSAVFVSQIGVPTDIYVTLTCPLMRQWSPGDFNFYPYEEPPNALPSDPCLWALAEMRRTKFYQVKCAPLAPMLPMVKILRDVKRRVPAWQVMTDWMIELVLHKVLSDSSEANEFCPGDALFALFNAISDGVVLQKGFSLTDPCEKLPVDAFASVTEKDRMNIFNSARYGIRHIKTGKMAKLLAMDGSSGIPTEHQTKRRKTNAQNYQSNGILSGGTTHQVQAPSYQFDAGFGVPQWHQPMGSGGGVSPIW